MLAYAGLQSTVDYSYQVLAHKGGQAGAFQLSASSVRTILRQNDLGMDRTGRVRGSSKRRKPDRPESLDGPNQCWAWDVSFIRTDVRRTYFFLFVMIDEWSRKVVAWRVTRHHNHEESMALIDQAILSENLLDAEKEDQPVVVNDRGSQMKARDVRQMFTELGQTQTFSRPKTPNDNPFIESFFSALKCSHSYPGWFEHEKEDRVREYLQDYFRWYNTEHLHSRIGYVTPTQKHEGLAEGILAERKRALHEQRKLRKVY